MGVYDCYGKKGVQLKIGPCELKKYNIGDKVDIPDGIYVGWEGIVIIHEGKLLRVDKCLITKYGDHISPERIMKHPFECINKIREILDD